MTDSVTVARAYGSQVNPIQVEIEGKKRWLNTRASKEVRYEHFNDKKASIHEKERWSIEILKTVLNRVNNPVVSCSFGIDSIVTLYLVRKALTELGRDPTDVDVVWCDTLNEFPTVRQYAKELTKEWELRLTIAKPKKSLRHVINDNGGITSDYFTARKGSRKEGQPLSEKCCNTLKHKPMNDVMKNNDWDCQINGLRADESRQRLLAALRDGEFFYSSGTWKSYVVRPILWWDEEDIWDYVELRDIPYNDLYRENLIQRYPDDLDTIVVENYDELVAVGIDVNLLRDRQVQTVTRRQALLLEKLKFRLFTPRTGCMMCPIPVKYGYMQWMRLYYPKVYDAMVHNLGYGPALLDIIPENVREEIEALTGVDLSADNAHEYLREILEAKPCTFDNFGK